MHYHRNPDEEVRDLERILRMGDPSVLPQLISAYMRSGNLNLQFLLSYPEAFQYLPDEWKVGLWRMSCEGSVCPVCQVDDHDCPLVDDCSCCSLTQQMDHQQVVMNEILDDEEEEDDFADEEEEEEEEDGDGDYECVSCGQDLSTTDQGETWALLSEDAATITTEKIGRGDEGLAMCETCLAEANLDLEQAQQEDLSKEFCLRCGETLDECECEPEIRRRWY